MEDPFSTLNSEDDDIIIEYRPPKKSEISTKTDLGNKLDSNKKFRPQSDVFFPTNPIFYPKLKYTPVVIEEDPLKSENKPWRDIPSTRNDYFNYGFTEEVWEAYKFKQIELRKLFSSKKTTSNSKSSNQKKTKTKK